MLRWNVRRGENKPRSPATLFHEVNQCHPLALRSPKRRPSMNAERKFPSRQSIRLPRPERERGTAES
jgi:hypothetical protein